MTDQEWGVKPPGWHGQPPPAPTPDYAAALEAVKEYVDPPGGLTYPEKGMERMRAARAALPALAAAVRRIADLEAANEMRAFTNTTIAAERDDLSIARAAHAAWRDVHEENARLRESKPDDELKQARVQLAGCLYVAERHDDPSVVQGVYGWSPAYEAVRALRERLAAVEKERNDAVKACDDNWVTHQELTALRERVARLEKEVCMYHRNGSSGLCDCDICKRARAALAEGGET